MSFDSTADESSPATQNTQNKPAEQKLSTGFLVMINIGMILAGSMTTIFAKIMD
jgi:hypothetical protein